MATIIGNNRNNSLVGTNHDDLILGRGGNDKLKGGAGNDTIDGGVGNDWIDAGKGNDFVAGGDGNDTIYGGNGSDSIYGGSGNDVIYGDNGNGRHDDGDRDHDHDDDDHHDNHAHKLASGRHGGCDDEHDDDHHHDHGGNFNDTIYGGAGNDWIDGGKGNDKIFGDGGNDKIAGGSGNDSLIGGLGADQLTGGSGQDHFIYLLATDSPVAAGWDRIVDFTQGQDKIDLAAFRNIPSDLDLVWRGEDPAVAGPWGVWYHNDTTRTFVYADTSGDGIADLKIELKNTPGLNLVVTDFIGVADAQVTDVNDAPIAADDVLSSVAEDSGTRTITFAALTGNDSDGDPEVVQTLTITAVSNAVGGTVGIVGGQVEFTPTLNFNGTASFDYTVQDNGQSSGVDDFKSDTGSVSFAVTAVNDAPVLDLDANDSAGAGANYATTFTENGSPVAIADADVGITDVDDSHIESATITLMNPKAGDSLAVGVLPAGIAVDGASTATQIILTGSATLADYQVALQAVTFSNSSENPDTTARDVTVVVTDGDANSNTAHTAITVVAVNDAPTITGLVVTETSISFVASDADNATLSLASPFASAFSNPTITSGATTTLTPTQQAPAVSGTLQVTDGTATANVVGLYLGTSGNDTATAPLAGSPNAMYGFGGTDSLTGGTGADSLYGGGGNDTLTGSSGNDVIRGGIGDDTIDGGAGVDQLDLSDGTAGITFILRNDIIDTTVNLSSIGLSTAIGDTYKNMEGVIGTNFNDTLFGSANDDALTGGGGTDIMTGNAGSDTFKFNATSDSSTTLALSDLIKDFVHGIDKIDLSAIDANTGIGGDQDFAFVSLANANTVANSVTWSETGGGNTILQIDNNGDTAADMQIVLEGTGRGLTDADFIL